VLYAVINIILQYNDFLLFPIAGFLTSLTLIIIASRSRTSRLSIPFITLMGHVALWLLMAVMEYASPNLEWKYIWVRLEYVAIVGIPIQWFIFACVYTNQTHLIKTRNLLLMNLIPITTVILVWTNQWHHLMWTGYYLDTAHSISTIILTRNVWFWIHSLYSYLLLFVGTVLFISKAVSSDGLKRRQIAGLVVGSLVPWVSNCIYLLSGGSFSIDPTPIAFTLTGILYFFNISQLRMLDISPIARNAIVMSIPEGIVVVDRANIVIDTNPAAENIIRESKGIALTGSQHRTWGQPIDESRPQVKPLLEMNTNVDVLQASFTLGNGKEKKYYLADVSNIHSARMRRGSLILLRDVTGQVKAELRELARVQAEAEMREKMRAEAKYRSLVETSDAAICSLDLRGNLIFMNQTGCRATGFTQQELTGKPFIELVHPTDRSRLIELFKKALIERGDSAAAEFRLVHKNGQARWFASNPSPIADEDGPSGFNAILLDITARKQAEEEKRKLQEKAQISSRLAAVGEMAAGIAHEINNPLTGVLGFSQILLGMADLPPVIREDVKIIADGSERVAGIVRRLLTFARQTKPTRTAVNVNELIDNNLKLRSYVLRTANIDVITSFDPDMPLIMADPGQLQQVFLNLIVNAEYVMKSSHGRGALSIKTKKEDCHVRISFQDDGPGIPAEVMPHLFEAFFTTKDVDKGNGLGLSLSRSIIVEHGGEIRVESEPGQGATFIIELPYAQTGETLPAALSVTQPQTGTHSGQAHILAVDDESSIRDYVSAALSRDGYSIDCSRDGREALDKIGHTKYDVVFTDIRMPGMGGKELYERIISENASLAERVVFMTGDVCDDDVKAFLDEHHLEYLPKPFDVSALEQKINGILIPTN